MPAEIRKEPCPECGKLVSVRAEVCPFCDADMFEDDDRGPPRRPRRKSSDVDAVDFIVPTNVSIWSILSCYLGLIGFVCRSLDWYSPSRLSFSASWG